MARRKTAAKAAIPTALTGIDLSAPMDEAAMQSHVLVVTGPKAGRWRAGHRFGPEPVQIPLSDLSVEDRDAIRDDPKLIVGIVLADADADLETTPEA